MSRLVQADSRLEGCAPRTRGRDHDYKQDTLHPNPGDNIQTVQRKSVMMHKVFICFQHLYVSMFHIIM